MNEWILYILEHWEAIPTSMSLTVKLGHQQCLTPNSLNQRWTNSPFLRFTIHCNSQVDLDDSIQLNSFFLGSQFQIILALRSMFQVWFLQSHGKLERIQLMRFIHISSIHLWDSFAKSCKYIPFAHLPHLLPTYSANQLQSRQSFGIAGTSNISIDFQWDR